MHGYMVQLIEDYYNPEKIMNKLKVAEKLATVSHENYFMNKICNWPFFRFTFMWLFKKFENCMNGCWIDSEYIEFKNLQNISLFEILPLWWNTWNFVYRYFHETFNISIQIIVNTENQIKLLHFIACLEKKQTKITD